MIATGHEMIRENKFFLRSGKSQEISVRAFERRQEKE